MNLEDIQTKLNTRRQNIRKAMKTNDRDKKHRKTRESWRRLFKADVEQRNATKNFQNPTNTIENNEEPFEQTQIANMISPKCAHTPCVFRSVECWQHFQKMPKTMDCEEQLPTLLENKHKHKLWTACPREKYWKLVEAPFPSRSLHWQRGTLCTTDVSSNFKQKRATVLLMRNKAFVHQC